MTNDKSQIMSSSLLYAIALRDMFSSRPHALRQLLKAYPKPELAWDRIDGEGKSASLERAKREMEFVERHHIRIVYLHDDDYPRLLRECPDAPVILFMKGNVNLSDGHFVSIVGTRQASERGKVLTREIVLSLAERLPRLTIISGLAYGIDIAAHRAALEIGVPTIIIPAHGLDRIYPPLHRNDAVRALDKGGIVTEYMSGTTPEKYNFVARNRIIAGMAECTVVIESREHGGALITARMAADYDRPVFAVPGRVTDDASLGCNHLIRDHRAMLLQSPDDLLREMNWQSRCATQTTLDLPLSNQPPAAAASDADSPASDASLTEDEQTLMRILRDAEDGVTVNDLVEATQWPFTKISSLLMMLQVKKYVRSFPGGIFLSC